MQPERLLDNRTYYDQFAASYETRRHHGYHLLVDELEAGLLLPHAAGRDVLEVGCGTGLILDRVAKVARTAVGMDLSAGMLARSIERRLRVVQAEATALPFADGSFDLTCSFKVLSHVPRLDRALAEMARVTRPGGRVFAELYNRHSIRWLARLARGGDRVAPGVDDDQVFVRFYALREMRAALPASLRLVRIHGIRIFTPLPTLISWPIAGPLLRWMERAGRSSPFARFGGFLVLECTKEG